MKGSNWIVRRPYDIRTRNRCPPDLTQTDYLLERKTILGAFANPLCLPHNNIRKPFLVLLNTVKSCNIPVTINVIVFKIVNIKPYKCGDYANIRDSCDHSTS
jgi:hypothetical protein